MLSAFRYSSRACNGALARYPVRSTTHLARPPRNASFTRRNGLFLTGIGLVGGSCFLVNSSIHANSDTNEHASHGRLVPWSALLRSYAVYSFCSVPLLVDYSPVLLSTLSAIPGLKQVTEAVVRSTFFAHFVGGDTPQDAIPLLAQLRAENKGVLLGYSVEVDQNEALGTTENVSGVKSTQSTYKQIVEETIRCIDVAADFEDQHTQGGSSKLGRKTWVAIKLTALLPSAQALISLSDYIIQTRPESSPSVPYPGCPHPSDLAFIESGASVPESISNEHVVALKELYNNLHRIAERGAYRGVKVLIDAEYCQYQPAIDAFALSLMRRFNKQNDPSNTVQPLVYTTFQAYLKRTPSHILQSLQDAKDGGYALGVKLVRGAYHPFEVDASLSPETCPVWGERQETDACYDNCATLLISALKHDLVNKVPRIGILFGTHNSRSCENILESLVREGVAMDNAGIVHLQEAVTERCVIGQLYGMADALTNRLVNKIVSPSPFVLKSVPCGPLSAVMPYLSRRAIENKSVLSGERGAAAERRRVGAEIRRRLLGF